MSSASSVRPRLAVTVPTTTSSWLAVRASVAAYDARNVMNGVTPAARLAPRTAVQQLRWHREAERTTIQRLHRRAGPIRRQLQHRQVTAELRSPVRQLILGTGQRELRRARCRRDRCT